MGLYSAKVALILKGTVIGAVALSLGRMLVLKEAHLDLLGIEGIYRNESFFSAFEIRSEVKVAEWSFVSRRNCSEAFADLDSVDSGNLSQ